MNVLKKKKNFFFFQKYLNNLNKYYDYFRNEIYFTVIYKKNIFSVSLLALLRDFFLMIGTNKVNLKSKIFFFSLPTNSGAKAFNYYNFFNRKCLLKTPFLKNKKIKCESIGYKPSIKFFTEFISIYQSIKKANNGCLLFIYTLRLAFLITVWKFFLEKNIDSKTDIYIHNDFDIYNSSLIYAVKNILTNSFKINIVCIQHGIPTDEFFPTKSPTYLLWSKKMLSLFKKKNPNNCLTKFKIVKNNFLNKNQVKREKKFIIEDKIYFISQGHTKIYGEKTNKYLIKFFNNLSENYSNTHCLLHPSENKNKNVYDDKYINNIHNYPHNFLKKNKIKVFVCFCSTAMLDIMRNGNIVIGVNTRVDQSKLTYKYFTPPLNVKTSAELLNLFKKLKNNKLLIKKTLLLQNKYLNKIYN